MNQTSSVKLGLIGCGWFAQAVHLPILKTLKGATLVALAEPDLAGLEASGRRAPAARLCSDYREVLAMPALDAVIVSVPTSLHTEVAVAAMRAGKHVYVEKPIASSLQDADDLMSVWRQTGMIGMVGFNYRFNPLYETARRHLRDGSLGRLGYARSRFSTPPRDLPTWKTSRATGGGVLLDLASHHIDLIRYLFQQDILSVHAEVTSRRTEDDQAKVAVRLTDGFEVQSSFSLCADDEDWFEIVGQDGTLLVDRYRSLEAHPLRAGADPTHLPPVLQAVTSFRRAAYLVRKLCSPWNEPSYRRSLEAFVAAICGDGPRMPSLVDGYRSLEVIAAAEASAKLGSTMDVHHREFAGESAERGGSRVGI